VGNSSFTLSYNNNTSYLEIYLMKNEITEINAKDGGLEFTLQNGDRTNVLNDPFEIKVTIISLGLLNNVSFNSSMDKASQYGFKKDTDAMELFEKAIVS